MPLDIGHWTHITHITLTLVNPDPVKRIPLVACKDRKDM